MKPTNVQKTRQEPNSLPDYNRKEVIVCGYHKPNATMLVVDAYGTKYLPVHNLAVVGAHDGGWLSIV
jgi:hypothetical protein